MKKPRLGVEYAIKMRTQFGQKVKPSGKRYKRSKGKRVSFE